MKQQWQQFALKFDALSVRERVMVFGASAALLIFMVVYLFVNPQLDKRKALADTIAQRQQAVAAIDAEMAQRMAAHAGDPNQQDRIRLERIRQEVQQMRQSLQATQNGLVAPERIVPMLQQLPGVQFLSVELTATRLYLKCVTPQREMEVAPGDIVQAGVVITNSEVGHGSLTVQPLLYRLRCSNGLRAVDRTLRKTHLGRITAQDEVGVTVFQDDTLRADDRAFFLKVRDVVQDAVSELTFRQLAQRLQRTRGIPLLGNPVKSVDVLGQRYHLNEDECSGVLRYLIEGGELSGYGLVNAVTHYSQALDDYDRATEFEALGGKLIELPTQEWRQLAEAA